MKIIRAFALLVLGLILGASMQSYFSQSDSSEKDRLKLRIEKSFEEDKLIVSFIGLLNQTEAPTLADYQQYFGGNDIHEMLFEWSACKTKSWKEPVKNQDCFAETMHRWSNEKESLSYFLVWLKKQLPKQQPLKINFVERVSFNNVEGSRVSVQLGLVSIEFWVSNAQRLKTEGDQLNIIAINKVPVSILEQQASTSSILSAMGLKPLVHPLTDKEWQQQASAKKQRCREDKECLKWLEELEQQQVSHKKQQEQYQQFNQKYRDWCQTNTDVCQIQTQERQAIVDAQLKLSDKRCAENYADCVNEIKQLMLRDIKAREPFCLAYPKYCKLFGTAFPKNASVQRRQILCDESGVDAEKTLTKAIKTAREAIATK